MKFSRALLAILFVLGLGACGNDESTSNSSPAAAAFPMDEAHSQDAAPNPAAAQRPGRIILVSLDTVGAGHVGGYSDAHTPTLEKIAQDGVRFDRFYAASSYTLPSHMSMMTGLDPIEHGVVNLPARIAPGVPTLASKLAAAGYETKAVTESGFVGIEYGFDQGFDAVDEHVADQVPKTSIWGVMDWMRGEKEAPYFLFVHTYIAHTPYGGFANFRDHHPELDLPDHAGIDELKKKYFIADIEDFAPAPRDIPVEFRLMCTFYNNTSESYLDLLGCGDRRFHDDFLGGKHFDVYKEGLITAYRAAIRRGDRMVGQIRDTLIELGQLEDTLLIVTSDHGDAMFEHSVHEHDYLPFDEVIKIPLFLSYPRRIEGPRVVNGLTWHLDLFPTILSLAQVDFDTSLRGEDLSDVLLEKQTLPEDRAIFPLLLRPANRTYLPRRRMALRGGFKFIEGSELYGDAEGLLFDLETSPGEDENLRHARPEMFSEYRELADDYDASLTPGEPIHQGTGARISPFPGEVEPYEISDEVRRGLTELGYVVPDIAPPEARPDDASK